MSKKGPKTGSPVKQADNRRDKEAIAEPQTGPDGGLSEPEGGWGGTNPPPPDTRFKPGQSGNPKGRPKGTSLTGIMRAALDANDGKGAEAIAMAMLKEASKGKFRHLKEVFDRIDGSVVQRYQIDTALDEMLRTAERVLERSQYARLVAALAGEMPAGNSPAETSQEQVH